MFCVILEEENCLNKPIAQSSRHQEEILSQITIVSKNFFLISSVKLFMCIFYQKTQDVASVICYLSITRVNICLCMVRAVSFWLLGNSTFLIFLEGELILVEIVF